MSVGGRVVCVPGMPMMMASRLIDERSIVARFNKVQGSADVVLALSCLLLYGMLFCERIVSFPNAKKDPSRVW